MTEGRGLAGEVEIAEDIRAIRALTHCYGYFIEKGLWDDITDLFSEDSSVEYTDGPFIGKAQVRRYFHDRFGQGVNGLPPGRLANHLVMQGVVEVFPEQGRAEGRWRSVIQNAAPGQAFNWGSGRYAFNYVKTGGVWRIRNIHWAAHIYGTYKGGWLDDGSAGRVQAANPPPPPAAVLNAKPSAPPTEVHKLYPETFYPPGRPDTGPGIAAPPPDPRNLAARIARLKDQDAIENLQAAFGYHYDKKQWDQAAALFTPDARWEETGGGVYIGRAHIRRAMEIEGPPGLRRGDLFNHFLFMPVVTVAAGGRTARGRWRVLVQLADQGRNPMWSEGVLENRYAKIDGLWRIAGHRYYVNSYTPHGADDWTVAAPAEHRHVAAAPIPPDAPPTGHEPLFPRYFTPPFHYPNPVSGRPIVIPEAPR